MLFKVPEFSRIKNIQKKHLEKDFTYNAFSYLILSLFIAAGILVQVRFGGISLGREIAIIAAITVGAASLIALFPQWSTALKMVILGWLALFIWLSTDYWPLFLILSIGILISSACELIYQWDKVVVLRMGRFHKVKGPGLFFLIPFIDRITAFVDTRIRATDFSAEKTITKDTVPVHVDALAFWMIWNAKQAVLEVENYTEAVILSAQTALRDSIGKHDLSELLSEREKLCAEIQTALDSKTNPWGITILSIEFTDIIIPQGLEDAMSKRAQAEREKQSRVILGTAEVEIAKKFEEASKSYVDNPTALHLRAMNMVYEGIRQKGTMILLPSSALESMNLGATLGTAAFAAQHGKEEEKHEQGGET